MGRRRINPKGRREEGTFILLPRRILDHENFTRMSSKAKVLLLDLLAQFNGFNNGDLCAAWKLMEKRGWRSRQSLGEALDELQHYGLVTLTRQGGRHKASLYAITWKPIDECKGKLDVGPTSVAPGGWQDVRPVYVPKRRRKTK